MAEARRPTEPGERERLAACVHDINVARERMDAARQVGARSTEINALRSELLTALEGYEAAITSLGAPVPQRLRAEIDLYQRLRNRG